jgi:hypothetical protein
MDHHGVFNCGHSLLATTRQVLLFLRDQLTVCGWLLEDFRDDPGEWPGWCRNVISLYARGLTVREIQGHLKELYETEVSPDLISKVTDAVLDEVKEWQSRPLDACHPIIFFLCGRRSPTRGW